MKSGHFRPLFCFYAANTPGYSDPMKYPNLRYGNPAELRHYAQGIPLPILARRLRRCERTVHDWLTGAARVPWWVPEVIRLQNMEQAAMLRQMGIKPRKLALGVVSGAVIEYRPRPDEKKPAAPETRPASPLQIVSG
jgi:hypothetical protein